MRYIPICPRLVTSTVTKKIHNQLIKIDIANYTETHTKYIHEPNTRHLYKHLNHNPPQPLRPT